jgi:hypothetical protein
MGSRRPRPWVFKGTWLEGYGGLLGDDDSSRSKNTADALFAANAKVAGQDAA